MGAYLYIFAYLCRRLTDATRFSVCADSQVSPLENLICETPVTLTFENVYLYRAYPQQSAINIGLICIYINKYTFATACGSSDDMCISMKETWNTNTWWVCLCVVSLVLQRCVAEIVFNLKRHQLETTLATKQPQHKNQLVFKLKWVCLSLRCSLSATSPLTPHFLL